MSKSSIEMMNDDGDEMLLDELDASDDAVARCAAVRLRQCLTALAAYESSRTSVRVMSSDIEPNALLEIAKSAGMTDCVIIGWDKHGDLYVSAANVTLSQSVGLIEIGKRFVMDRIFQDE